MSRCPNCNYELVLLEHRCKYKCAKCGKLFPQQVIELKDFQSFNKKERQQDKEKAFEKKAKLSDSERNIKSQQTRKSYYQTHKEAILKNKERYYEKNRDKIIVQKREYRKTLSGQQKKEQNEKQKERRLKNIDETRVQGRINHWKIQQKALALQIVVNRLDNAQFQIIEDSLPNISLS